MSDVIKTDFDLRDCTLGQLYPGMFEKHPEGFLGSKGIFVNPDSRVVGGKWYPDPKSLEFRIIGQNNES